jgi:tetratricopeptide (TPR) repeat protein
MDANTPIVMEDDMKPFISRLISRCLLPSAFCLLPACASQQENVKTLRGGYDALGARQYDAAITAADQVLAGSPKETLPAEAHYLRGRVFEERAVAGVAVPTNLQNARSEYIAALGLPHRPDLEGRIRAGAANVAFAQEDYGTALQQWSAAYDRLEKPQDKLQALYKMGRAAQRLGRWDEADKYFNAVQEAAGGTDLANKARQLTGTRGFIVQLATFASPAGTDAAVADLRRQGIIAQHVIDPTNRSLHLLRVGPMPTYADARSLKARFAGVYPSAVIMP